MRNFTPTLIFGFAIVFVICGAWGAHILDLGRYIGLDLNGTSIGDWGDSFSALNTFFSGAAFVGIAATIFLQVNASKRSIVDSGKEEFERVFFQMFSLIRQLRKDIEFERPKKSRDAPSSTVGAEAVAIFHSPREIGAAALKAAYHDVRSLVVRPDAPDLLRAYNIVVNRRSESEFSPYFRVVYSLLNRIDKNKFISSEDKLEYSRLLRSQMTSYEACILGMNGLTAESKDLRHYIIKFRMLKYSKEGEIRDALGREYPEEAFLGRG